MKKRQTNQQFVLAIMKDLGPMAEMFVYDAIGKLADAIAAAPPIEHPLINGQSWKAIGTEIKRRMEERA